MINFVFISPLYLFSFRFPFFFYFSLPFFVLVSSSDRLHFQNRVLSPTSTPDHFHLPIVSISRPRALLPSPPLTWRAMLPPTSSTLARKYFMIRYCTNASPVESRQVGSLPLLPSSHIVHDPSVSRILRGQYPVASPMIRRNWTLVRRSSLSFLTRSVGSHPPPHATSSGCIDMRAIPTFSFSPRTHTPRVRAHLDALELPHALYCAIDRISTLSAQS